MSKVVDWEVLTRYLSGESDSAEIEEVELWLEADAANQKLLRRLKKIWNTQPENKSDSNYDHMWENIRNATGIDQTSRKADRAKIFRIGIRRIAAIAAVMVIGLILPYFIYQEELAPVAEFLLYEKIDVDRGQSLEMTLADGSVVTLDSGSELKYKRNFNGVTREVFLHGEAYFEVKSDPDKPFIVHAGSSVTRVLGTAFNLRSWAEDGSTTLAVAEGRVSFKLESSPESQAVIVTKDQLSSLTPDGVLQEVTSIDIKRYLSWINGSIQLSNSSLSEIIDQIERWYDIEIQFADQSLLNQVFTIHLTKESLDDVLLLLSTLTETTYTLGKGVVQFS